jgi:hypothetical protein
LQRVNKAVELSQAGPWYPASRSLARWDGRKGCLTLLMSRNERTSTIFCNGPRVLMEQPRILFFGQHLPLGGNQLQSLRGVFSPRVAGRGELEADQGATRQP